MRYTPELKAEALKRIENIGVAKTADVMKISSQTLYKWRNATKSEAEKREFSSGAVSAKELLESDRLLQEKISQLEAENNVLRATLLRYRAALAAVLGEGTK